MKENKESCVELNIYVECGKRCHSEPRITSEFAEKKENDETCVKINVFADCDDKK